MENKPSFQEQLKQDVLQKNASLSNTSSNPSASELLEKMLQTEALLTEKASKEVVFSPPILTWQETGVFKKGTINVIQGKFGCHKSRLAELFCSLFLRTEPNSTDFLGFEKLTTTSFSVSYIDTERNLCEEVPATIQNIREKAGGSKTETMPNFYTTSIKRFERKDRLEAVKQWVTHLNQKQECMLFVVLDVVTDCLESFNNESESMALFDFLGNLCDDYGVTFLLLIHENPNTEKARGHTGTEAANKASCVIQIGWENEEQGLIKLRFIKLRGAARPQPIFLSFCPIQKGLVVAAEEQVQKATETKRKKADLALVKEQVELVLTKPLTQQELLEKLIAHFNCSENTLKARLKEIIDNKTELFDNNGNPCLLVFQGEKGKPTTYHLESQNVPTLFP